MNANMRPVHMNQSYESQNSHQEFPYDGNPDQAQAMSGNSMRTTPGDMNGRNMMYGDMWPNASGNAPCDHAYPGAENVSSRRSKQEAMQMPSFSSRSELLNFINEVSFAEDDITLYLNTHPYDQAALAFFQKNIRLRKQALKLYAENFGPLTIDTADDAASDRWEWVMQPWPWEGGACK